MFRINVLYKKHLQSLHHVYPELFYNKEKNKETSSNVVILTGGVPGISDKEIMNITDQIQSTSGVKRKRFTYSEQDKMKIVKHELPYSQCPK